MDRKLVTVDLSGRAHTGIVVMRPHAGEERGLLLLNVAETQARIRHLPGFLSATFLSDHGGRVLVEFLEWRSAKHVEVAFREPAFHEHLPIVTTMAPHPVIAFGAPAAILTARGEPCFALNHRRYAATVFRVESADFDGASKRVVNWVRSLVGGIADAAIVLTDRGSSVIGALLAGDFVELPVPDLREHEIEVVEHLDALYLYTSICAAVENELSLDYVMAVLD